MLCPVAQVRTWRLREVKKLTQGHTAATRSLGSQCPTMALWSKLDLCEDQDQPVPWHLYSLTLPSHRVTNCMDVGSRRTLNSPASGKVFDGPSSPPSKPSEASGKGRAVSLSHKHRRSFQLNESGSQGIVLT